MVRKIFRTLLLTGVLFLSVLFCIEFIKERNILSAVLIGIVCLLTIDEIIYAIYRPGVFFLNHMIPINYTPNLVVTILGTLYFLGTKDTVLFIVIFLQLVEICINGYGRNFLSKILSSILTILFYSALIACIFNFIRISIFDFLHIVVLIISCIPLVLLLYDIFISKIIFFIGTINARISFKIFRIIFIIDSLILLVLSIIMKVKIADTASGSFLLYSIIALVTSIVGFVKDKIEDDD